tara:strand:+ start:213 stop:872 length:660 start_codon:yes stop_codon:yes gene_type:complete
MPKLKIFFDYISRKILHASTFTFNAVNNFCISLYQIFIRKNFFSSLIIFSIIVFYQSIISILNFEIAGKEFTFGDDLNYLVESGFALIWNLFISFIRSFSPSSPLGLALELLSEIIALSLFIIGHIVAFAIWLLKTTWQLIIKLGIYNMLVIISWLYVIEVIRLIYEKFYSISRIGFYEVVSRTLDEQNLIKSLFFSKKSKMLEKKEESSDQEDEDLNK